MLKLQFQMRSIRDFLSQEGLPISPSPWIYLRRPKQTVGQTIETRVIWDTIAPIVTSL